MLPNGHNVLWESFEETASAIEPFLAAARMHSPADPDPLPGYIDDSGSLQPLL